MSGVTDRPRRTAIITVGTAPMDDSDTARTTNCRKCGLGTTVVITPVDYKRID